MNRQEIDALVTLDVSNQINVLNKTDAVIVIDRRVSA